MPRDRESIVDMLNAISSIRQYVTGMSRDDFENDVLRQDAVVRRLEIIGEAAKRLSEDFRQQHVGIPWKQMAGMRDRVIHGYDTVDVGIVWDTVQVDLPDVARALQAILDDADSASASDA